jgi:hypothetical protein
LKKKKNFWVTLIFKINFFFNFFTQNPKIGSISSNKS